VPSKREGGSEAVVRGVGSTSFAELDKEMKHSAENVNRQAKIATGFPLRHLAVGTPHTHLAGAAAAMAAMREGLCAATR
jgi:hypothetical protein